MPALPPIPRRRPGAAAGSGVAGWAGGPRWWSDGARRWAVDVVLAAGTGLLCWYAATEAPLPPATGVHEPAWLTVLAGVVLGAPVAARRRWPTAVAVAVAVAAAACLATGVVPDYASSGPLVAAGVALYTVGAAVAGRRGSAVLLGSITAVAAGMLAGDDSGAGPGPTEVAFVVLVLGACWVVGVTLRERRAYAARAAGQATAQAVTEERLRIAREIHDIVGHSLSLIAVKAAVGRHVARERPEEAGAALDVIASASRGALAELRRAVGALRTEADFAPAPGLAELRGLADRAVEAGVAVRLEVHGECDVPEGVALTAFRIVQESLTNVVKHAGPTTCRVEVVGTPGELRVEVTNDGAPARPAAAGSVGLSGMRERVALHHGTLAAGPRDRGGFTVLATLPYQRPA
ncbi:sensor histidine kinase [Jidongwangia harbinensis]|uniref:sensor histidine kinase n=1 Tax=Jidongwangia harbinensis TaxID=2878561 RepID=UPI001CD96B14|nr:sensor histidine kinase [Jidongwangia harbinensis]MCA2215958.1 sensor histidine kinase [Jidongwangia harbinensis]